MHQRKTCIRCHKEFKPTGANTKRCPPCRHEHHLEACKDRWHRTYVKKGYNQSGKNNNAWKGGSSPAFYQKVAYTTHGTNCVRCGATAALVHHKDGDRSNSQADNLEPLCKRCHQTEHDCAANLPDKVVFHMRECVSCSSRFRPTGPRSKYCKACGGKGVKV
jgi:hypothetical protein